MLKNLPLRAPHTLVRRFGSDAEAFTRTQFQNQPLHGHTGLDFSAPPGTPVYAVAGGLVLRAGNDTDGVADGPTDESSGGFGGGFGGYVVLHHPWGQTLYARLQDILVRQGDQVAAGTFLGQIAPMPPAANSAAGNETGDETGDEAQPHLPAHLHFGLRVTPYSLRDGWAGFVDPAPYLARLTTPQGPIIGPHIIATIRPHLPTLARWQPRLILVLDPNPAEVAELRAVCPNSTLVARLYVPEAELEARIRSDPQSAAQWAHEKVLAHWSPHVDYWQIPNELLQNASGLPVLNQFELARMALADAHGYKCAILAFSVGNPDLPTVDRMAHWRLVYPALDYAEQNHHLVAIHQYGMPTLWGPDNAYDWYIHRLEHQILRRLPFKQLRFAVTEFGIDGLIRGSGPAGWKAFSGPEQYVAQLQKAARYLERYSPRIVGYAIFTLGHYPPWSTYDIAGPVADALAGTLERGTWLDMNLDITDIAARESDSTTSPGPEFLPGTPDPEDGEDDRDDETGDEDPDTADPDDDAGDPDAGDGSGEIDVPPTEEDDNEDESDPDTEDPDAENPVPPGKPAIELERRLSPWVAHYNIGFTPAFQPVAAAANTDPDALVYLVKDIFTTRNGAWEPDDQPGSVPAWARAAYLRPLGAPDYFDDAGADHHLFAAVIGLDGQFLRELPIAFWSDGLHQAQNTDYTGYVYRTTKEKSGWANIVIGPSSSFVPERGEAGPWCWAPTGQAEIATGGGLPAKHHISTFVVWQAVRRRDLFPPDDTTDEDPDAGDGDTSDGDTGDRDYSIHFPVIIRAR
ncbi:MAG: M23 family metallopeptidase [Litorilinea sp.]